MKDNNRRIGILLLAIVLMFTFAGCKQDSVTDTVSEVKMTEKEATEATQENTEPMEESKLATFPYTGEEVTFSYFWFEVGQHDPLTDDMIVAKAIMESIGNINLELEILSTDDYDTKQPLYLASGEIPDIMVVRNVKNVVDTYGPNEIFLDYALYMDEYMPNIKRWAEIVSYNDILTNESGNTYGLSSTYRTSDWVMMGWFANSKVLSDNGATIPTTQEELVSVLMTIRDNDPELVSPLWGRGLGHIQSTFLTMNGTLDDWIVYDEEAGKWEFGPTREGSLYKDYYQYLNTLYSEKLMTQEITTATSDQMLAYLSDGSWAIGYEYFSRIAQQECKEDIVGMMPPSGISGKSYAYMSQTMDGIPSWGIVSSASTENPELLVQVLDYLFSDEFNTLQNWGIEGETFVVNDDGTKSYTDMVITGLNPEGTYTVAELGFWKTPWDRTFGTTDIAADMIKQQSTESYPINVAIHDALDAGSVLPIYKATAPNFTTEENEIISTILAPMETYRDEAMYKFMMGEMDFDEWDEFIAGFAELGDIQQVLDIYNSKEMLQYSGRWR